MTLHTAMLDRLFQHIPPGARVLDLGCGTGDALIRLQEKKHVSGYGIDIELPNIQACIKRGLAVYHGDIDEGLQELGSNRFDYAILSQTLQQVKHPIRVLSEMLRVAQYGLVTFPNFAHWKNRIQVMTGITPVTPALPYHWYNTPNIRVITILDFMRMCQSEQIEARVLRPNGTLTPLNSMDNLLSEYGFFRISKKGYTPS